MSFFGDMWKGHVLAFELPLAKLPGGMTGLRYVAAFALAGPGLLWAGRKALSAWDGADALTARLVLAGALLMGAVLIAAALVRPGWAAMGLRSPGGWTRRETLYALQVVPAAAVVFFLIFRDPIEAAIDAQGLMGFLVFHLAFGLAWGFYQEFTYRGLLQTALSTWLGPWAGVLLANLAFTFGTLHASIWAGAAANPQQLWLFLPVFGIGLVFGTIFQRSGNLWLPTIFHGLWPLNMF